MRSCGLGRFIVFGAVASVAIMFFLECLLVIAMLLGGTFPTK
jgi:hypothetical protein